MKIRFEVISVLGKKVVITEMRWALISEFKHPIMADYEKEVKETLKEPDEVRRSKKDKNVYLYYKKYKYYVCVLIRHLDGAGVIITAYMADKMKKGDIVWKKETK